MKLQTDNKVEQADNKAEQTAREQYDKWVEKNCPNLLEQMNKSVEQASNKESSEIVVRLDALTLQVEQLNKEKAEMGARLGALELEVKRLGTENQDLKALLEVQQIDNKETTNSEQQIDNKETTKILGFSVRQENTWTQGKQYTKYYAIKRIAGRHHRIYLGGSAEQATDKIKAYAAKHSLILSPVV